jgi:sulfatase maturation enzyme AslB (radical SAM superfamily)
MFICHNYAISMLMEQYKNLTESDYNAIADPSWPSFREFSTHHNIPERVYTEINQMLDLEVFDHPSFCVLPFIGYEYPSDTFCCLAQPRSNRELVKKEMLNSNKPAACNKCWNLEEHGICSDRHIKNSTYDFYTGNIKNLYNNLRNGKNYPISLYKIDSSNLCNATCVTCGDGASSAWISLNKRNNIPTVTHVKNIEDKIYVDYKNADNIMFRGGEPFLELRNFEILQKLVDCGNTECVISFVTNGSIWPSPERLELLKKFPKLIISLSIDGIGSVFEYLRYPLSWDSVVDNINKWKSLGVELGVSYTLSNLNILYHNETVAWFKENDLPFLINPVYSPEYFGVRALPAKVKDLIYNKNKFNLLLEHSDNDDINFQNFIKQIKHQDQIKKISINDYLPELVKLLELSD